MTCWASHPAGRRRGWRPRTGDRRVFGGRLSRLHRARLRGRAGSDPGSGPSSGFRALPDRDPGTVLLSYGRSSERPVRCRDLADLRPPEIDRSRRVRSPCRLEPVTHEQPAALAERVPPLQRLLRQESLAHKAARDQLFFLSSGITFNVLVTIVPLLLITISVLGILVEASTSACEQILSFIQRVMPLASAQAEAPAVRPGGRPGLAGRGRPRGLDLGVDTPFSARFEPSSRSSSRSRLRNGWESWREDPRREDGGGGGLAVPADDIPYHSPGAG